MTTMEKTLPQPRRFTAKQVGGMRVDGAHPNTWEMPCGCIFICPGTDEPVFLLTDSATASDICLSARKGPEPARYVAAFPFKRIFGSEE